MGIRTAIAAAALLSTQALGQYIPSRAGGQLYIRPRKRGYKAWCRSRHKRGRR